MAHQCCQVQDLMYNDEYPKFSVFIAFLNSIAEELNDPLYGAHSDMCYAKLKRAINSSAVKAQDHNYSKSQCDKSTVNNQRRCLLCQSEHPLYACRTYKKKPVDKRIEFVSHQWHINMCSKCFSKDHRTTTCFSKVCCRKCEGDHSTFMVGHWCHKSLFYA